MQSAQEKGKGKMAEHSDKYFCAKCCQCGGLLLRCGQDDCYVSVHEKCLQVPLTLDASGLYCCVYCVLKRATSELIEAKNKFVEVQQVCFKLSIQGPSPSEVMMPIINEKEQGNSESEPKTPLNDEQEQKDVTPDVQVPDITQNIFGNESMEKIRRERIHREWMRRDRIPIDWRRKKNYQVNRHSIPGGLRERRNKLRWSAEEEYSLKEGILRFPVGHNECVPWAKILEFGQHVFNKTRRPLDLKDKWRNIKKKEAKEKEAEAEAEAEEYCL